MLTLQAWFDDSGGKRQGRWMVIAGLFGEAEVIATVSDQWREALEGPYPPGRIAYFKMDEACKFDGQFAHWRPDHRDMKVRQMARLIDRPDLLKIYGRLDLEAYERIGARWSHIKRTKGDVQRFHSMEQPYLNLAIFVVTTAITDAVRRGATDPIEIVFDEQSLLRPTLQSSYDEFRRTGEPDHRRLAVMPVQLGFRDDRQFVILQAADLIAGELRLAAEAYDNNPEFIGHLCPNLPVSNESRDIREADLEQLYEHTVRTLVEMERQDREGTTD